MKPLTDDKDVMQNTIEQSSKLGDVCYDIRGPALEEAKKLEAQGHKILKLNIGNPAPVSYTHLTLPTKRIV